MNEPSGARRMFVALNLPADERRRIGAATAALRRADLPIRWVPPENLHLTLAFLGNVEAAMAARVEAALAGVASSHPPVTLDVGAVGAFPGMDRARVVWMGIRHHPALTGLHRDVVGALEPLGFPAEDRRFRPHLTLGRVRKHAHRGSLPRLGTVAETVTYRARVEIHSVDLVRSRLSREGARYDVVSAWPLAGPPQTRGTTT